MNIDQAGDPPLRTPLRLWPGVVAVVLQWLIWIVVPALVPAIGVYGLLFGMSAALAIVSWWLFFSRAPWLDRVGAIAVMPLAVMATIPVVHTSLATGLMALMMVPILSLALVGWAAATARLSSGVRRVSMVATMILACATLTLVRTDGVTGDARSTLHWRWTPTAEQNLLAQARDETMPPAPARSPAPAPTPAAATTPETTDRKSVV